MHREAAPVLKTGRKWAAKKAVEDAKAALRIGDIMGQVQHGRGGLGLSSAPPTWHKAAPAQRRKLVVNEVQKQEERMRCIKAISQAKQGEWMRWESVEQRKIGWQDLWSMEQSRISFLISFFQCFYTLGHLIDWTEQRWKSGAELTAALGLRSVRFVEWVLGEIKASLSPALSDASWSQAQKFFIFGMFCLIMELRR
ncbi:UNVERIFIED_CONTAM: hypothetical protein FKN15_075307 [Acipenser sinensis]